MKPFWKSKTVWFNVITTILALATELTNATGLSTESMLKIYAAVISVGNIILRVFFTEQPIGTPDEDE